jgi:GntR family transcriptional repressor for pyruvate dehydrogenase complex
MDKELLGIKVVRKVISLVSTGQFKQGQKLPAERILCEMLGVSRGTLRQGLADLQSLGVIKIVPRSGIYIKKYSEKKLPQKVLPPNFKAVSLGDIINARKIIEIPSLELACEKATKDEIKFLSTIIEKMEKAVDDLPEFLQNDMNFHQTIVTMGKNLVLVTAFEAISEYLKYSQVYSSMHEGEEEKALDFHRKIFDAICAKDSKQGCKVLEQHLNEILKAYKF